MQDIRTYRIEVLGSLDEHAFNETSPLRMAVLRADPVATTCQVVADQSGLVGLVRHLHRQGFVLLSVIREC